VSLPTQPILAAHLLAPLNDELVALLRTIQDDEWLGPTIAGSWTVKDVTAHLLDTSLRRLSKIAIPDFEPNRANREWIVAMQRVSPRILIELIDRYGREQAELLASLDPFAKAQWGVAWAGEEESLNWFDVARELTERWHHQAQIRDALGRPPLFEPYLGPVIDTFVRGVPHAYRDVDGPSGTSLAIRITNAWTLRREENQWRLFTGGDADPTTTVTIDPDAAWRLFTKARANSEPRVEGDARLAEPLLRMICVIG
jgi:uncharacterized protein (TIGR03083 family)